MTLLTLGLMETAFSVFRLLRSLAERTGLPFPVQVALVFFGTWFVISGLLRILPWD